MAVRTDASVSAAADVSNCSHGVDQSGKVSGKRVEIEAEDGAVGEPDHADAQRPGHDDGSQLRQHVDEEPAHVAELRKVHPSAGRVEHNDHVGPVSTLDRTGSRRRGRRGGGSSGSGRGAGGGRAGRGCGRAGAGGPCGSRGGACGSGGRAGRGGCRAGWGSRRGGSGCGGSCRRRSTRGGRRRSVWTRLGDRRRSRGRRRSRNDAGDEQLEDAVQLGEVGQAEVVLAGRIRHDPPHHRLVDGGRHADADEPDTERLDPLRLRQQTVRLEALARHPVRDEHENVVRGGSVGQRRPHGSAGQPQRTCRVRVAARVPDAAERDDEFEGVRVAVEVELQLGPRAVADRRVPDVGVARGGTHDLGHPVGDVDPVRDRSFVVVADAARMVEDEQDVDWTLIVLGAGRAHGQLRDDQHDHPD